MNKNTKDLKDNIDALDEIHKGACMGMDALNDVFPKVGDEDLLDVLKKKYHDYKDIARAIEDLYPEYNNGEPHSTSAMNKMMTKCGIDMNTQKDTSNSKIAELLLNGVNMGIIEGRKTLNKKNIDKKVSKIVNDYVSMQEKAVEVLKRYL